MALDHPQQRRQLRAASPARRSAGRARRAPRARGRRRAAGSTADRQGPAASAGSISAAGRARAARASAAASGAARSTQPTTPRTRPALACATSSRNSVSATRRRRLHEHGRVDAGAREQRPQVGEREVAVDRRQRGRQPSVVAAVEPPHVVVRVDAHRAIRLASSAAASHGKRRRRRRRGAARASRARMPPESDADASARFSSSSAIERAPASTHATAGCARGNCSAAAFSGTRCAAQTASIAAARASTSALAGA